MLVCGMHRKRLADTLLSLTDRRGRAVHACSLLIDITRAYRIADDSLQTESVYVQRCFKIWKTAPNYIPELESLSVANSSAVVITQSTAQTRAWSWRRLTTKSGS